MTPHRTRPMLPRRTRGRGHRDAMWQDDRAIAGCWACRSLAVGPGSATLTMTVREDMLNGHDICHGGLVTTLADSAFAYRLQRLQRGHGGLGLRRQPDRRRRAWATC
ncbi:MAG: hypothetical protein MZW92_56495 [Comamonadaceae bacterium]|nr:hypothetical protein [Comamonadaceae bacterium]